MTVTDASDADASKAALLDAAFAAPPPSGPANFAELGRQDAALSSITLSPSALTPGQRSAVGDNRFSGGQAGPYTRHWSALAISTRHYDVDFSPHASLGLSNAGQVAEAGGTVQLGAHIQDKVMDQLHGMGVRTVDGASFGDRGRWFLFAAASGRAVGLNMIRNSQGSFQRAGWSAEGASALVSDAQAGLGWRKGAMQASFGYVHREIKTDIPELLNGNSATVHDSMVAFSLSIRPQ